ncbi:MAG: hypothetical protein ABW208_24820 [Pyrinomonadaceae bacterium]
MSKSNSHPVSTPATSVPTLKASVQKSVLKAAAALPARSPTPAGACPLKPAWPGKLKDAYELFDQGKELYDLYRLKDKSVGAARRAVGAARQVVRLGRPPTLKQFKFAYGRAFTPSRANVLKEAGKGGLAGALGGAVALLENAGQFKRGEISGGTYAGRVAYGAGKGVMQYVAGAAAAPFGATVGAAFPPAGGALAGSAIGYQVGKLFGGDKGAKIGTVAGGVVGAAAGAVALAFPGAGQAFGAAAGAIGASMWASEGAGAVMDGAASKMKKLFSW